MRLPLICCLSTLLAIVHGQQASEKDCDAHSQQAFTQAVAEETQYTVQLTTSEQSRISDSVMSTSRQQALLQAWTKSEKGEPVAEHSSAQTRNEQIGFADLMPDASSLKFYLPLHGKTCDNTVYPDTRVDPGDGMLKDFRDWLWVVEDERYDAYVIHRLACSASLVNSPEEADLCFPTCTGKPQLAVVAPVANAPTTEAPFSTASATEAMSTTASTTEPAAQVSWMAPVASEAAEVPAAMVARDMRMINVCFEVPPGKRDSWSQCKKLCLQPEASDPCSVEVPYLHGVLWPQQPQANDSKAPWNFNFDRRTLLTFVGCKYRGNQAFDRAPVIAAMQAEALRINPVSPESVFVSSLIEEPGGAEDKYQNNNWYTFGRTPRFFRKTWELYAGASFCWQPHGDTPTRHGLYDSLMFGCVPVIDAKGAASYGKLFKGLLWKDMPMENVFVVIPDGKAKDGPAILQILTSMPPEQLKNRRLRLQRIASKLQWSAHTPNGGDAFLMALMSFRPDLQLVG